MTYVNKDKALEICEKYYQHCLEMHDYNGDSIADAIKEDIEKLPTAEFAEVKHGEWVNVLDFNNGICIGVCSVCGTAQRTENATSLNLCHKYCRWCGAKMDGKLWKEVK